MDACLLTPPHHCTNPLINGLLYISFISNNFTLKGETVNGWKGTGSGQDGRQIP